jgi:hypothetical protein
LRYRWKAIKAPTTRRFPPGIYYIVNLCRVVVKNERGERIIDTLIKSDDTGVVVSQEKKLVREFSLKYGPTLSEVSAYLAEIFRGDRVLIGYHIEMILCDLELENEIVRRTHNETIYDVAKMFNQNPLSGQQWKFADLCTRHLNLVYKKPSSPYAVREKVVIFIGNGSSNFNGALSYP